MQLRRYCNLHFFPGIVIACEFRASGDVETTVPKKKLAHLLTRRERTTKVNRMVKLNKDPITRVFHALADPTRREILSMVATERRRATELAECFDMSFPAVSKHIKVLERAKLLDRDIEGRIHRFTLNEENMKQAYDWLTYFKQFWSESLDGLDAFLSKPSTKPKHRRR